MQIFVNEQRDEFNWQISIAISQREPEYVGKHWHEKSPVVDNCWHIPLFTQGLYAHGSIIRQSIPKYPLVHKQYDELKKKKKLFNKKNSCLIIRLI